MIQHWHERFQQRLDAFQQRISQHFETEMRLLAELGTRQKSQLQQMELLSQSIKAMTEEFRQHRSDEHESSVN
jgi:uncharacterized membrane-anchored protein YhcB (DUF1043 family)